MNIYEKLLNIQNELNVPKKQFNKHGNFYFRNCEDIQEAVKPLLVKYKLLLTIEDEIVMKGEHSPTIYEESYFDYKQQKQSIRPVVTGMQHFYIKSTCTLRDIESEDIITTSAYARESSNKTNMDDGQMTGTASSYASKYALNKLFLLDDNKDADTNEYKNISEYKENNSTNSQSKQSKNNDYTITDKQISRLYAIGKDCDFDKDAVEKAIKHYYNKDSAKSLLKSEYDFITTKMENTKKK